MIRNIIQLMAEGELGIGDIQKKLGMSRAQLDDRLETMVRMGYLKELEISTSACGKATYCKGCVFAKKGGAGSISIPEITRYRVTDKGLSILEHQINERN